MNLEPLWQASFAVKLHVFTVVPAFVLGAWQIFASRKGAPLHRAIGFAYLLLMTITALSTLFIHTPNFGAFEIGGYQWSWIHLFVPLTLFGVWNALRGAQTHDLARHKGGVFGSFIGGAVIAGALSFQPGRIMHSIVTGG